MNRIIPHHIIEEVKNEINSANKSMKNEIVVNVAKAIMSPVVVNTLTSQFIEQSEVIIQNGISEGLEKIEDQISEIEKKRIQGLTTLQTSLQSMFETELSN